jgi:uncharacterized protein (TIGR04222 family)
VPGSHTEPVNGDLSATEIAYLNGGGTWSATRTALAMLHARGRLTATGRGRVERTGSSPHDGEPLEKALFAGLVGRIGPRELMEKPRVRAALRDVRRRLVARGLLRRRWVQVLLPIVVLVVPAVAAARITALPTVFGLAGSVAGAAAAMWFLAPRPVAGTRELQRLRREYADLAAAIDAGRVDPVTLTIDEVGVGVALFGNRALRSLMPVAARDAGLLDGGRWTRLVRHNSDHYGSWTGAAMSELDHHNPTSPF